MKHLGDITKINGTTAPAVEIITGGSPCQDLSVAGKREGLAGERSGLFMEQIRIIKEMRDHDRADGRTDINIRPRYMVWENVAGAFSSNNGEDFRAVLEETVRVIDKNACVPSIRNRKWPHAGCIMGTVDGTAYSVAWRLHDAQFWGVPQRRKRIALVADFGGTAAPEILFECESMSRNTSKSERESKRASDNSERSIGETSKCLNGWDVQSKHVQPEDGIAEALYSGECRHGDGKTAATLTGDHENRVTDYTTICVQGNAIDRQPQNGPCEKGVTEDVFFTLNTVDRHAVAYKKTGHPQNAKEGQGYKEADIHDTLNCFENGESRASAVVLENHPQEQKTYQNIIDTIDCGISKGTSNQLANQDMFIANVSTVRRLTPKECERLQGFPDDWTNIGDWIDSKGKKHKGDSDTPRYKALGNSLALPFWEWMAKRMAEFLPEGATMASLFDGIGGFPLVFSRAGITPVWASEIEEFPIAVTKIRFPEREEETE